MLVADAFEGRTLGFLLLLLVLDRFDLCHSGGEVSR